jgi:hypothetical protein
MPSLIPYQSTLREKISLLTVIPVTSKVEATESKAATQAQQIETLGPETSTITSSVTNTQTVYETLSRMPDGQQEESSECVCEPTISTVYATVTMAVAETTVTSIKTVEPPFPSSRYGTGTGIGAVPLGTGVTSQLPTLTSDDMSMSTGAAMRRWLRRGHGHGHGHQ